jgi:hypothetical protein
MPAIGALSGRTVLLALGGAQALIYLLFFWRPFPLAQWWQYARLDYAWLSGYELAGQLRFVGAFAVLFVLYQAALLRLRAHPEQGSLKLILLLQLIQGLPLVWTYPVAALDLYDYVLYARLGLYWGANPLAQRPSEFPAEPLLAYSYWPDEPSVYGPIWQTISVWLTALTGGQLYEGMLAFKLLALLAALATSAAIFLILRRTQPALAPAGALVYAWNPLQQFETAGNAHNDALMVLFLVLTLGALAARRSIVSLPLLAAGLLVKVTLAPLAPLVGLLSLLEPGTRSKRLARLALSAAMAIALVVACYLPFWEGRASLPFLDRGNWFTASPPTLLRELFRQWQPFETAGRTAATVCAAVFLLLSAVLLWRFLRSLRTAPPANLTVQAAECAYQLFFAYLVVACLWWQPWYLLILLVLAALSGSQPLTDRANLFCLGGLLSYPVFKYIWGVHQADWQLDYLRIMAISVAVIFTLPLLHLVVSQLRRLPLASR